MADLIGLCPFHDDRSPSLVVTPSKNLWHCLGACQEGGSVIDWVMKLRGVSFRHAVEILRSDAPPVPTNGNGRRVLPSPVATEAEDREVLAQVVAYYHETLKQSPEALGYLESRGPAGPRKRSTTSSSASRTAPSATACRDRRRGSGCSGSACCGRPATST